MNSRLNSKHEMLLSPPVQPFAAIAFLNFILLFILLIVFYSFFANPSAFEVRMPVFMADSGLEENHATIQITAENVLYFNEKVVTINDLKRSLVKVNAANTIIYVRVDPRASMGRVVDVWDLCKGLGIARVRIVAS